MAEAKKTTDRRMFLGEAAAAAAALTAMASLASAETTTDSGTSGTPSPDVIADIKVIKDDHFSIPGGGEDRSTEWEITGQNGVLRRFRSHGTRIDRGEGYTLTTDVTILSYPAGADREARTPFVTTQRSILHGTKGEVKGSTRMDEITLTTIFQDGTSSRSSHVGPVRTDLAAKFERMSLLEILRKTGEKRGVTFASSEKGEA